MPRPRDSKVRAVRATHLKFLGVTPNTLKLYKHAVHEFFTWRLEQRKSKCKTFKAFDEQLSQYINGLYLKGDPMYKAANALSGFKRLMPQCRKSLEVSSLYYSNWAKSVPRRRALPLKADWVRVFGSFAQVHGQPELGVLVV